MRHSTAVSFLLFSVFVYSIFPLIGTKAVKQINPVLFIGLAHVSALMALTGVNAVLLVRRQIARFSVLRSCVATRWFILAALASGAINAASHACLFASFIYISSASATALYEVWPAAAVLLIGRLLPRHYLRVASREWLFIVMALAGIGLLIKSATSTGTYTLPPPTSIAVGVLLALLSAGLMALSSSLDVVLARRFDGVAAPYLQPVISQNIVKIFSSSGTLIVYFLFFRSGAQGVLDSAVLLLAVGTGIFVIAFGAVTYHIGNILAESPAVNVLWYLTPVLSLLWLDVFGVATITAGVAVGAILIITANLLLTTRADPQTAYSGALGGLCLSAFFCSYIHGTNDEHYCDLIIAVTGFFAILAGFMLNRVSEKAQRVARAALEVLEAVRRSEVLSSEERGEVTTRVIEFIEGRTMRRRGGPIGPVSPLHQVVDHHVDMLGRKLAAACGHVVSFSEMLVLVMLAGIAIVIAHVSRPDSFIGDLLPVVLTGVIVFLCVRVFEEEKGDVMNAVLAIYRRQELIGPERASVSERGVPLISIVLLIGIFVIYVLVLVRKHGIPFTV